MYHANELDWQPKGSGVWRYQSMLPVKKRVSMSEGGTPLILRKDVKEQVYLKLEGDNPTGSFKDRGTTVVISDAIAKGYRTVSVASTGNMGASVAAYCAYANLEARVFIPKDVPREKVSQIEAYGANLIRVDGSFSKAVERSIEEVERDPKHVYLASTGLNPLFIEGLKTVGYEIFESIGVPDRIIVPSGTGGMLTSIFKAYEELKSLSLVDRLPRMIAVQAEDCSPIVNAWRIGGEVVPQERCHTIASAIMVKVPFNAYSALDAIKRSGGEALSVSEGAIIESIRVLGKEGVFAEPASAAAAAALQLLDIGKGEKTVLVITGSGLKDPNALFRD
jgi:threonine synthase